MDLTKLGRTEQVLSVAGLLVFVFSFFSWAGLTVTGEGVSQSATSDAWQSPSGFNDWFPILLMFAYGIILFLPALGVAVPIPALAQASTRAFIGLVLSALGVLLWAIQALTYPSFSDLMNSQGVPAADLAGIHGSVSLEFGYFIVLVVGLVALVQSYLGFTQNGGSFSRIGTAFKARSEAVQAQQTQPYGAAPQEQPGVQPPYGQPPQDPQQPPQAPYGS